MSRLEVRELRYLRGGPLSLSVEPAECVSLMGASGSGKTLLLRALVDLDEHEGDVSLDGARCSDVAAPAWRRRVGMLPAESAWWAETVAPHFPKTYDGAKLEGVGLDASILDAAVERLSTGERQRLALARVLANEPEALLLDEPTASLDSANIERAEALIAAYRTETSAAVLWVSHDREQAARVASRHARLQDGTLVWS